MDYILSEAEEAERQSGQEEEEGEGDDEETEDTGIGTYSQFIVSDGYDSACSDRSATESTDGDYARRLLHLQESEDRDRVHIGLGGHPNTGRGHGLLHAGGAHGTDNNELQHPQPSTSVAAVHAGDSDIPKKMLRNVPCQVSRQVFPQYGKAAPGISRPNVERHKVPTPGTNIKDTGGGSPGRVPVPRSKNSMPKRNAAGAIQVHGHDAAAPKRVRGPHQRQTTCPEGEKENQAPSTEQSPGEKLLHRCLTAKNYRNTALAIFKELYTASYTEVTRAYKSDKTQSHDWVFVILGAGYDVMQALRECLKAHCDFLLYDVDPGKGFGLYYCGFINSKNRDGVKRLLRSFNLDVNCIVLCDPPNKRSIPAALFYQRMFTAHGETPSWCRDIVNSGELAGEGFELSKLVQWALDNMYSDESTIAYNYAQIAEHDPNAQLWLKSNSQAKYVRDAATMVRHYLRGQLHAMPMVEHIAARMRDHADGNADGWKKIVCILGFQHVVMFDFLLALKYWLKARPKRCALAMIGVPDSGKSLMCMTLTQFLGGNVLSFNNSKSHFWLQPLADCKCAAIDDVTLPCWDYLDQYMRNALDGNTICIDCKHRAPMQIRCPPLLLSSNYDIREIRKGGGECAYKYLLSRISIFSFNRPLPVIGGSPRFLIEPADWRSFFLKFHVELDLDLQGYDYGQDAADAGEPPEPGGRPDRDTAH